MADRGRYRGRGECIYIDISSVTEQDLYVSLYIYLYISGPFLCRERASPKVIGFFKKILILVFLGTGNRGAFTASERGRDGRGRGKERERRMVGEPERERNAGAEIQLQTNMYPVELPPSFDNIER